MINALFVCNGEEISGAEVVLRRFMSTQRLFLPTFLLLGCSSEAREFYASIRGHGGIITVSYIRPKRKNPLLAGMLRYLCLPLNQLLLVLKLRRVLRQFGQIKLIYANNTEEALHLCMWAGRPKSVRLVCHVHDTVTAFRPLRRWLVARYLRRADAIICVSKACRDALEQVGVRGPVMDVIYNGIDEPDEGVVDVLFQAPDEQLIIGYNGSLIYRKGFDILVRACAILTKQGLGYRVVYIHRNDDNVYAKRVIELAKRLGVADKLIDLGSLPVDTVGSFYESIDLLVVPSRHDPLPTVVMEALVRGKVVVAARVDGLPEMLDEEFLFDPADPDALAAKLVSLWNRMDVVKARFTAAKTINARKFSNAAKIAAISKLMTAIGELPEGASRSAHIG